MSDYPGNPRGPEPRPDLGRGIIIYWGLLILVGGLLLAGCSALAYIGIRH